MRYPNSIKSGSDLKQRLCRRIPFLCSFLELILEGSLSSAVISIILRRDAVQSLIQCYVRFPSQNHLQKHQKSLSKRALSIWFDRVCSREKQDLDLPFQPLLMRENQVGMQVQPMSLIQDQSSIWSDFWLWVQYLEFRSDHRAQMQVSRLLRPEDDYHRELRS